MEPTIESLQDELKSAWADIKSFVAEIDELRQERDDLIEAMAEIQQITRKFY